MCGKAGFPLTDESLTDLGRRLEALYQAWPAPLETSWPDSLRLAVHDWEIFAQVDAEFARLLRATLEWLDLEDWLCSGFFPAPGNAAGLDPTRADGALFLQTEAVLAGVSHPQPQAEVFLSQGPEPGPMSAAAHRNTTAVGKVAVAAKSADVALADRHPSPSIPSPTGPSPGLSGGGLRDLARVLQAGPNIAADAEGPDKRRADSPAYGAETDGLKQEGALPPSRPLTKDAPSMSEIRFHNLPGATAELPEVGSQEPARHPPAGHKSGEAARPDAVEETRSREPEYEPRLNADELRRFGLELADDMPGFAAGDAAGMSPAATPASALHWRKLLSILPLRREIFMKPHFAPEDAGTSATMNPGDDSPFRAMPFIVEHKLLAAAPPAPLNSALEPSDVQDLLEALSEEIWREYQCFYGPG